MTRDVDARFLPHGIVLEQARHVAEDLGLPPWWLDEQATVYISGQDDLGKRRVFDHPGLRVMAASPQQIFAMKARPGLNRARVRVVVVGPQSGPLSWTFASSASRRAS